MQCFGLPLPPWAEDWGEGERRGQEMRSLGKPVVGVKVGQAE